MENTFTAGVAAFLLLFALCRYLADSARRLDFIVQTPAKQKKYLQAHLIFLFSPVRKNKTKMTLYFDRIQTIERINL